MKKQIKLLLAFTTCMLLFAFAAIAQTDSTGTGTGGGSTDPFEAIFMSVAALSLVILPITGWVVTHLVKGNSRVVSWVVALLLASLGHFLNLGEFGTYNWYWTIGYGIIAALTANGMADTSLIKGILTAIAAKAKV
jgi:hypothetical protein